MADENDFSGHLTMADGSHVVLSPEEAEALWKESERSRAERAKKLPDERSAIDAMFEAFDRLRELGWRDAIYCPKDGTRFQVIEAGSTGIFCCHYEGKWPTGSWWIEDAQDMWPSRPILFRLFPADEAAYKEKMAAAVAKYQAENPR